MFLHHCNYWVPMMTLLGHLADMQLDETTEAFLLWCKLISISSVCRSAISNPTSVISFLCSIFRVLGTPRRWLSSPGMLYPAEWEVCAAPLYTLKNLLPCGVLSHTEFNCWVVFFLDKDAGSDIFAFSTRWLESSSHFSRTSSLRMKATPSRMFLWTWLLLEVIEEERVHFQTNSFPESHHHSM